MKVFFFKYLGICGLEFFEVYGIIVYGEREISNLVIIIFDEIFIYIFLLFCCLSKC